MSDVWKGLVEKRRRQRLPLKEIAGTLDCDVSYLSHVEHGRRAVTPKILAAYEKHIGDVAFEEAKPSLREATLSGKVLSFCKTFRPYTPERLAAYLKPQYSRSAMSSQSGLDTFSKKILRTKLTSDDIISLVWTNVDEYRVRKSRKKWRTILSKALSANSKLKLLFTPSTNEIDQQDEVKWLIFESLNCLNWKQNVTFDSVSDLQFSHFPIDFFLLENRFSEIRFSGRDYQNKVGLVLDKENGALRAYVRQIESYRDQRIKLFFGIRELSAFFEEYLATESQSGPRYLSQPFPGSHTRPPQSFEEGSNWWNHYASLKIDVERLAITRKRAASALRQRMKKHHIRQICSKEAFKQWAQTGNRIGFRRSQIREDAKDRRNQIQYIINLIKSQPNFSMAIVGHSLGNELGWSNLDAPGNVNWVVQGEETLILESHANALDGKSTEFQCVVRDVGLAAGFKAIFNKFWDGLPTTSKESLTSIAFLESLKDDVS
jgi:transcriptional regulator with XRE-family HTH domain